MFKTYRKLWWGLLALIVLSPLGLLATGTAFGEWSTEELIDEVGFIPAGLSKFADFWRHVPLPDYSCRVWQLVSPNRLWDIFSPPW